MFVEVNMKLTFCADEMPFRAFVSRDNEKTDTPSTWETRVCFAYSAHSGRATVADYPFLSGPWYYE